MVVGLIPWLNALLVAVRCRSRGRSINVITPGKCGLAGCAFSSGA
jgi:hypothetical protein